MNAWDRIESNEVYEAGDILVERIRYSVFVSVETVACFWYGVMLGRETV